MLVKGKGPKVPAASVRLTAGTDGAGCKPSRGDTGASPSHKARKGKGVVNDSICTG
ncbi:protein of unknown function [Acidithiobacillus ferrivorans]|uniref:Transposase n=1 Tax=Acidithiobacillus ferrivorans TaxID=160808 RepID=A0ABY1MME1_9PROT|nr:protein of unknown function [Acidithiobacillus ferrivorans]